MTDRFYCYPPDFKVLKNKFGIRDGEQLDAAERSAVRNRLGQGLPTGRFDLNHLKAIHGHLFQDVYEWAGEIRQVEISKGHHHFQPRQYIETGMADIHGRLKDRNFLRGLSRPDFAKEAGRIIGDVNYVHPFREGNGRTQVSYLKQLGEHAGHKIDLSRLDRESWIKASIEAHAGKYERMGKCIEGALEKGRTRQTKGRPTRTRGGRDDGDRSR